MISNARALRLMHWQLIVLVQVRLRQKYHAPQVRPDRDSNFLRNNRLVIEVMFMLTTCYTCDCASSTQGVPLD